MPEETKKFRYRLSKAAKEFNVSVKTIREFLAKKGFQVDSSPNAKLTADMYDLLGKEYQGEKAVKDMAKRLGNPYYKGGNVSVKTSTKTTPIVSEDKHDNEQANSVLKKENIEIRVIKDKDVIRKEKSKEKKGQAKVEYDAAFSELKFEQGYISIIYDKRYCIYRDYRIRDYNKTIEKIYTIANKGQNAIKASIIRVVIDLETETFVFKDIDILRYVNRLKEVFCPEDKKTSTLNEIQLSKVAKEINMDVNVLRKYLIKKGFQVDSSPNAKLTEEMYALLVKEKKEVSVSLNSFHFGTNVVYLKIGSLEFVLWETDISPCLNYEKSILNNISTRILLDYSDQSFQFLDSSLLSNLKELSARLTIEEARKHKIEEERRQKKLQKQKEKEAREKEAKEKRQLKKQKAAIQQMKTEQIVLPKNELQTHSSAFNKMTLRASNIRFYNGYYLIFQTVSGEIDNSVTPYRIDDPNSHEILNLVHKYFEQILEQKHIIVKYDETKILEPSRLDLFQLGNYVRDLKRNLDEKDVWWEEVQNARKRSFGQCFGETTESVKKRVTRSKNEFLYNLSSLQNEKKLIRVYEINHGKEEDAFIFTISMSNNRCAIVFENASKDASTTTWIFVAKEEDYETCINLVFDYFTDYTISLKRSSLRSTINPPEKFKAESYAFIYHDDIGQWLKKLNKIIGQTPEPSEIQFVPGLHIPESSDTRSGHGETISTRHLHNQLMSKLYDKLCSESGKDNVGTEIRVGTKRIDTVVKGNDFYDIYEIKIAENPFECVTEALGQLCQYTYLFCRDKIGKMVIVGPSKMTKEVKEYLSWFRKNYSLQLYYMKV